MGKKIMENGWLYEYEETAESQIINGYEVTGVRYVLGEKFDTSCKKVLICIGINPSTAIPEQLDPTLKRVQKHVKNSGEYGAWYMLNVYPQRATNPNEMDIEPNEKCKLLFVGKEDCRLTLEDVYNLSSLFQSVIGSALVWDIIGDYLHTDNSQDLDGYLIIL